MIQDSISLTDRISWNEIEALFPTEPKKLPAKLTFYRDTNGWCPFCERVWIALEHKQIEYDTIKINLKDKPQWFKDIVPTALVPAIELHNSEWVPETPGSGKMMWESMDILNSLDELFPDTPRLRQAFPRFSSLLAPSSHTRDAHLSACRSANPDQESDAMLAINQFQSATFRFVYAGRLAPADDAAAPERLSNLTAAVERLESVLARGGGPFLCGTALSVADCAAAPFLERYRHQLPLAGAGAPRLYVPDELPALARWYDAMDACPAFARRASGDAYSWLAVVSAMSRGFGPSDAPLAPAQQAAADAADRAAADRLAQFAAAAAAGRAPEAARQEAARALAANRDAVAADAVRAAPLSQLHIPRVPDDAAGRRAADAALRAAAWALLAPEAAAGGHGHAAAAAAALRREGADPGLAARAARVVAARLCVPRDMGAAAGAALRTVLLGIAAALDAA